MIVGNQICTYWSRLILLVFILLAVKSSAQYCAPQYQYVCDGPSPLTADFINNFSTSNGVTNITNNNTGCNNQPNNFIYYSGMTVTATQGCSFNVSMQCGSQFSQGFGIWIDWNQDLDYNDAGEFVYNSGTSGFGVYTGTIQVPATATLGTTRMRVRCTFSTVPSNPCTLQGSFQVGEVEEYNVNVVSNTASNVTVSNQTICAGTSTSITATAQGIIRWYLNPTSAAQIAMGPTFTTPVLNATTTYYVQATFGPCTTPRVPVTITVIPPFSLTVSASQNPVCAGTPFTLTASGGSNLTYAWSPATAFTNATVNPASAVIAGNTTFTVTGTDVNGCNGTGTITMNALAAATLNLTGTDNDMCPGETSTLTVSGGANYSWSPSTGLSATTGSSVTATPLATTTYIVTSPSSTAACAATASYTITVHPLPTVDAGSPVAYCAGGQTNLLASGANSYTWSPVLGLNSSTIANPVASPVNTTTYTVTGTSVDGCVASDQVTVTVNPNPTANPGSGAANCSGTGAQLNGSGGVNYSWSPTIGLDNPTISNPIATPSSTTNYSLTVTDANGCISQASSPITVTVFNQPSAPVVSPNGTIDICSGQNVVLTSTPSASYLWSNGATTQSITVTQTGNYSLHITDANGCVSNNSSAVIVNVNPTPAAPVLAAVGTTNFCQGGSATLYAVPSTGILWNNGSTNDSITINTTGQYSATYTDLNGCVSPTSNSIQINVTPLAPSPSIIASGPLEFCEGDSVTLSATPAASYLWSNGSTAAAITVLASGTYSVTIGATCPPLNPTVSKDVLVRPLPVPTISADLRRDCLPSQIHFSASSTGIGPFSYAWTFGDGQSSGAASPMHEYVKEGLYNVTLKLVDVIGCSGMSSEISFIEILQKPIVEISINPPVTTLTHPEVLLVSQTENGIDENWQIDQLGEFLGDTINLTLPDTGTYNVNYSVVTDQGCEVTLREQIRVVDEFQIFVPTGFTPNGDGLNDVFVPICSGCTTKNFDFRVYNRWGEELFSTNKPNTGWAPENGTLGVYVWRIAARGILGEDKIIQGNISILR
jgi:gliding motility-associated-like protein